MVVICLLYCDCDLTALLYLLIEMLMCAAVCMPGQAIAFVSRGKKEMQRLSVHSHQFIFFSPLLPANGFPLSLNRRANTPAALCAAISVSKQY